MLPKKSIHSIYHLVTEIHRAFKNFDRKVLNEEILKLRKEPNESVEQFYMCFHNLAYRFLEDEIDWEFLDGRFEYLLHISKNPQFLKSFGPRSAYFDDGVAQSQVGTIVVTSDRPPSPHQIAPPPWSDVGENAHTFVELSHPPTPSAFDIYAYLACKLAGGHVDSFPQPLSLCFIDPPDCTILCSIVPESTLILI